MGKYEYKRYFGNFFTADSWQTSIIISFCITVKNMHTLKDIFILRKVNVGHL